MITSFSVGDERYNTWFSRDVGRLREEFGGANAAATRAAVANSSPNKMSTLLLLVVEFFEFIITQRKILTELAFR